MLYICMCTQAALSWQCRCEHGSVRGRLPSPGAAIPSAPQRRCWGSSPPPWYPLAAPGVGRLGTAPCALPPGEMQVRGDGPWQAAGPALRRAGSCGLLQPPASADRVLQRPPQWCLKGWGERRSAGSVCAGCFVAAGSAGRGILLQHPSR